MTNVIDRARERIERDGWMRQGPSRESSVVGGLCILTALLDVLKEDHGREWMHHTLPLYEALWAEIGRVNISGFNDDPSTSLEDVLLVMKRASARLDEEARDG